MSVRRSLSQFSSQRIGSSGSLALGRREELRRNERDWIARRLASCMDLAGMYMDAIEPSDLDNTSACGASPARD